MWVVGQCGTAHCEQGKERKGEDGYEASHDPPIDADEWDEDGRRRPRKTACAPASMRFNARENTLGV
ncbi:hypothetical protein Prum_031590 [Phytohabitans rumicis]|uniref:Uncharacterized protein n=1 Tax=Phytohabitans rumicis TaxID=1076125 RepID=A0A6V8L664_9ACTN|nr:hypothetical protein Prum_031590 [Phytohabitans rumicis]